MIAVIYQLMPVEVNLYIPSGKIKNPPMILGNEKSLTKAKGGAC